MEMDGHDWDQIHATLLRAREVRGKPVMILAHTIKARGCTIVENRPENHNIKIDNAAGHAKYMAALTLKDYSLPY